MAPDHPPPAAPEGRGHTQVWCLKCSRPRHPDHHADHSRRAS